MLTLYQKKLLLQPKCRLPRLARLRARYPTFQLETRLYPHLCPISQHRLQGEADEELQGNLVPSDRQYLG
jgi:hypothetical protein